MRTPADAAHSVFVAGQDGDGALLRGADVEGADDAVDARRRDDGVAVLVPVVGEGFAGGDADGGGGAHAGFLRRVDRDVEREVVCCARWGAQVEDPEVGVGGYAA